MFCSRCGTWAPNDESTCSLCGAALQVDNWPAAARPAAPASTAVVPLVRYGGFWRRFAGLFIDSTVLFFPDAIVRVLLGIEPLAAFDPFSPEAWLAGLFELVTGWLYSALLIASPLRGTLGQQVMDLQVTDLRGARVSFGRATWRCVAQFASLLTLGVGYLVQVLTPRRQALHDWMSGTVVVRPQSAPRLAPAAVLRIAP